MSNDNYDAASLKAVLTKATTDADFRAKCLSDPAGAAREIGVTLPAGIVFTEEKGQASAIVLPPLGADPDEIHDELLLADVAGGVLDPKDPQFTNPVYGPPECQNP